MIPIRTVHQWNELSEFFDSPDLKKIMEDIFKICDVERAYLQKVTGETLDEKAFTNLRVNRFTERIHSLYTDIREYYFKTECDGFNYTSTTLTDALRFVKSRYEHGK